ncbi:uncharacterized protein NECHADRAFT_83848 [Fusarium vanettenii 77-13-4]|uniref:J domain-containing protein n=1 Tax=Fusarium vanettenii (strain ATCC MYA-4622 / CBS 123669 / FGSC 9596 / NRRL 45880 / 77-13-4) TaxID=660122 RepID=C7YYY6_FUSV7|nr:uncharacterized protein NECHADRAFT_83848 [Fusarium vanettenii 77-13-4]EEU43276.1 hypothetical protein NECHADRAFT_83848 [Fusarium vanettenii 77-13-4]
MSEAQQSPRRRHILSSINPDKPRSRRRSASPDRDDVKREPSPSPTSQRPDDDRDNDADSTRPRRSRLRLKDHHRSRQPLDPEVAFRESLFDAMADDEGAAYWEGVYGQPIHVYSNERVGPTGYLEQMTEEEYAAHVRQKMWEKTHAGLIEERARREEARKRKAEEDRLAQKLQEDMERSLRRGEERRQRRRWITLWEDYISAWTAWDGTRATLAWPVESGRREDVDEAAVRKFLVNGLNPQEIGEKAFVAQLKDERVRWHPDKIQQKLGGQVDEDTMKGVTAVFQIIDRLWVDSRPKA